MRDWRDARAEHIWMDCPAQAECGRLVRIAQAVTALVLLTLAFHTGKTRFVLLTEGVRAAGRIVDYKEERFSTRSVGNMTRTTTTFLPVVQFQAAGQVVTFTDWMGSPAAGEINDPVTVLYDPARPSVAMIDRPVWNWDAVGSLLCGRCLLAYGCAQRLVCSRKSGGRPHAMSASSTRAYSGTKCRRMSRRLCTESSREWDC